MVLPLFLLAKTLKDEQAGLVLMRQAVVQLFGCSINDSKESLHV